MEPTKKRGRPSSEVDRPQQFVGGYVSQEQKRRLAIAAELSGVSVNRMLGTMIDGLTASVDLNANRAGQVVEATPSATAR